MEVQTKTVTGYRLDSFASFIESVNIYSVEEGPCSDFIGYITMTFLAETAAGINWT